MTTGKHYILHFILVTICLPLFTVCCSRSNTDKMSSRGGKKKSTKTSRSAKAGVIFPVGRMLRYIKKGHPKYRIGVGAPVYMAAVLEYLTGKINRKMQRSTRENQYKHKQTPIVYKQEKMSPVNCLSVFSKGKNSCCENEVPRSLSYHIWAWI